MNDRLKKVIDYYKITPTNFSQKIGVSEGTIRKLLTQNTALRSDTLEKISQNFTDIDIDWLITGRGGMLRNEQSPVALSTGIPLIPIDVIAGIPAGDLDACLVQDSQKYIVPEFQNLHVDYLIRVSGSSMYPKYSNGDILACRKIDDIQFFQWGKIYVIDSSQGALVKRVFEDNDPERILLVSDNREKYPPFSIPKSDIRSVSIVLGVIRLE